MGARIVNFNAGPAGLPTEVLEEVQAELLDYRGSGMSIMEASHRAKDYDEVHAAAQALLLELFEAPKDVKALFLQGGASLQFGMVPMNFLAAGATAEYVDTGAWSQKAIADAKRFGKVHVSGSTAASNYDHLPDAASLDHRDDAVYCHVTTNNTIFGTQWHAYPDAPSPLVCDMSSDVLSRRIDWSNVALAYAGAQKNLGPSGLTVVLMREGFYRRIVRDDLPAMLDYRTHWEADSLYNTPPTFAIYILKKVLEWVKGLGGLTAIEARNREKAEILYGHLDSSGGFCRGTVANPEHRSWMNVTFRLPNEGLEKAMVAEAEQAGFCGLKGHRSVGGIRVSMYNAVSPAEIRSFVDFARDFERRRG